MPTSCTLVIFGATGNLAGIKLLPALYHLEAVGRLPDDLHIVGFGRRDWSDEAWRNRVLEQLPAHAREGFRPEVGERLAARLHFHQGDITDGGAFESLAERLRSGPFSPNHIYYLAVSPNHYAAVSDQLGIAGLSNQEQGWRRLVVEKPFGFDHESACQLDRSLHSRFDESQLYRIDHYLGKSAVQNVMVFRFANLMLEPLWNRNYIDHVQISHSEVKGISGRAGYYDGVGALRDMLQSHLLQVLTLVAMEPPANLDAMSLRDEKVKVLRSVRPIDLGDVPDQAVRAQYAAGEINGKRVPGYLEEEGVVADSATESYAALRLFIDNWRWRNVPFYLRTGKRMQQPGSMIGIRFKHPPQQLFNETPIEQLQPNWILLNIQPDNCLRIELQVKEPGLEMRTHTTHFDAGYCSIKDVGIDAYEALLLDVVEGDHALFLRYDEVDWAWRVVDPVLRRWAAERDTMFSYPAGSWGPEEADRLLGLGDRQWRNGMEPDS